MDIKTVDKKECGGHMIKDVVLSNRKSRIKNMICEVESNAEKIIDFPTFLAFIDTM